MTAPICSATRNEKTYCDKDDEPLVSASKPTKSGGSRVENSDPDAAMEDAIERNETRARNFGALGSASYDASSSRDDTDARMGGARGAGGGPGAPSSESEEAEPEPTCVERRGAGIAIGVNAGVALGLGPGFAAGIEGGVIIHQNGISGYLTDTKMPTHCEKPNGDPDLCSQGVGASAGVGVAVHVIPDVDSSEGDGRAATIETPAASAGLTCNDSDVTSYDGMMGPSVGAAMHVTHVNTKIADFYQHQPICESPR